MRGPADADRICRLARELGRVVPAGTRMYLTGGATAVLEGWRESTVDIDVRFEPDSDDALSRIRDLKDDLAVNVKLASPLDFLPPLPGREERSRFTETGESRFSLVQSQMLRTSLKPGFIWITRDWVRFGQPLPSRLLEVGRSLPMLFQLFPALSHMDKA